MIGITLVARHLWTHCATEADTTTEAATTTEPVTTTEEVTTEPARLCSTEWANTIVQEDNTIRFLDSSRRDWCIFKKYADFKAGDEVWYAPCDVTASNLNKAGKYTWIYNQETKQIQSKGAQELKNKRLCWRIPQTSKLGKQRIRIQACDDDDINQKWNIIAGRLHPVGGERLCVGIQENLLDEAGNAGIAMTTIDCYPHIFGAGACAGSESEDLIADADKAIRPMGQDDENLCFFKKYTSYNNGDEIWIKGCDAGNANYIKAGKYRAFIRIWVNVP